MFVDDVMSAGSAEDARKCIKNLREMERKKKFSFGLKKTNYMVVNTGREPAEKIEERVKAGVVPQTDEYKYVGLWINQQGNCSTHIEKKAKKVKGEVAALKNLASFYNVGETFLSVRLRLYESCIVPSILYNLEGWNKLSKTEISS